MVVRNTSRQHNENAHSSCHYVGRKKENTQLPLNFVEERDELMSYHYV